MLIVDDCSTDNTRELVAEYNDPRIKYHCLEQNSGAAVARNTALRLAKGRWIAFLDSDDLWRPKKLEHQIEFMIRNKYGFSCTDRDIINENGNRTEFYVSGPLHVSQFGMRCYCWVGCLTAMYDRDVVGLIQIENIPKNNDYAIWLKVIRKADCYLLKENLASYRSRKGSISHHSKIKLIKWHYRLFRICENSNPISASFWTVINLFCGVWKKLWYEKRIK